MKLLKDLYAIHSKSGSEKKMRNFIKRYASTVPGTSVKTDASGNLYVTKGDSDTYPCIVAHMDQVQHAHAKDFKAIETEDIIFGYSRNKRQIQGLGADDKNGIWVALNCLKEFDVIKLAFFVGEEVGCVGSSNADMAFFGDCRFVLQCDRKHSSDLITNASGVELCSDDFVKAIGADLFGYRETNGIMTDVMELKENGLGVSCVNISCGYYDPHTDNEYTVKSDLYNCLDFVRHIIRTCTDVYPHEYTRMGYGFGTWYGNFNRNIVPSPADYDTLYDFALDLLYDGYEDAYDAWQVVCSECTEWGIGFMELEDAFEAVKSDFGYDEDKEVEDMPAFDREF